MHTKNPLRWSRKAKVASVAAVVCLVGGAAAAASNWAISLSGGSSAAGQAANITSVSISAVSTPSPTNLLYPGGTGDAVLTITNTNPFPVTITAVSLPSSTTYAAGYSTFTSNTFSGAVSGCAATGTVSDVVWNYSGNSNPHTLTSALTVGANGTLTVTMTNDVSMTSSAPLACAGLYFDMPSLTGITATGGAATATSSPTTDSWTS